MDAAALLLVATVGGRAPQGTASVAPPLEISAAYLRSNGSSAKEIADDVSDQSRRTVCQPRPGRSGWSWRQVDGRKCWYRGPRRTAKSALAWAPERPARTKPAPAEAPPAAPEEPMPPMPRPRPPSEPSIWDAPRAAAAAGVPPRPVKTISFPEGESWEPPPRLYTVQRRIPAAAARPPFLPGLFMLLGLSLLAAGVVTAGVRTIAAAQRPLR